MKRRLFGWGGRLGLGRWLRARNRRRLLVLMYHGVVERPLSPFCWWQLPLARFEEQVRWLRTRYHVLPLHRALEGLAHGDLPDHACAITFDDAYANVHRLAMPILRALDLPATVFVVTGLTGASEPLWPDRLWQALAGSTVPILDLVDLGLGRHRLDATAGRGKAIQDLLEVLKAKPREEKDRLLEAVVSRSGGTTREHEAFTRMHWDDMAEAAEDGRIRFGAHSHTHEILARCGDDEVALQVRRSIEDLSARLPAHARAGVFAYPNGRARDFDERATQAVADAGVDWALSTRPGLAAPSDPALALPRVGVGADDDLPWFKLLCAGI